MLLPSIAPSCLTLASWVPKLQPPSDWTFGKLTRFGRVEMDKQEQQTMRTCFSSRTFVGPTRYSSTVAYLTNHWLTKVAAQERNKKALFDENIVSNIWKNAETVTYPVPLYKLTKHFFFGNFQLVPFAAAMDYWVAVLNELVGEVFVGLVQCPSRNIFDLIWKPSSERFCQ